MFVRSLRNYRKRDRDNTIELISQNLTAPVPHRSFLCTIFATQFSEIILPNPYTLVVNDLIKTVL